MEKKQTVTGLMDFPTGANHWYKGPLIYGNGCGFHDDCFTCPLRACRYEDPRAVTEYRRQQEEEKRRAEVLAEAAREARLKKPALKLVRGGMSLAKVGTLMGISERRARNYIAAAVEDEARPPAPPPWFGVITSRGRRL